MTDSWLFATDEGSMVGVAFIDLSQAFDRVNPSILIHTLASYRCSSVTVDWFKSSLRDRTQTVNINGHMSDKQNITCVVPQGSYFGPLLFMLFVNNLHLHVSKCDPNLHADDTMQLVQYW